MYKIFNLFLIITLSLLVTSCDSGDGDGGGGTNYGGSPGFENAAADNATGADNEVIATVKAGSTRSVDVDAFISAVANELGCDFDDIQVTGSTTSDDLVYISFIFLSNADNLLADIQSALSDGNVGGFQVMIVIANMDDDIACGLGEDCEGICGGSAFVDACGECGGDSSGCDDGDYVGLYQLYSMKLYDDYDDDNTCSGSVEESWSGPTFNISEEDNDDTDCSDCECEYGQFEAEIRIYVELKANGQYRFFRFENESVDEHTYCWGNCYDNEDECDCYTYSDDENEFNLETGTWSVDDGMLSVNACTYQEWEWGTENNTSTCYEYDSIVNDGCLSEDYDECNDGYNDEPDEWEDVFEETSQGFYIHDPDDDGECERMEFRRIGSFPDVSGCTDPFANNYNAAATADDGTCGNGSCNYGNYNNNNMENSNKAKKSIFSLTR